MATFVTAAPVVHLPSASHSFHKHCPFIHRKLSNCRYHTRPFYPTMSTAAAKFPTVYINHGGGPLPLLGRQPDVVASLVSITGSIPKPDAIVVISAHFQTKVTTILTHPSPPMLYDYYGFPPQSYKIRYPAPSALSLLPQVRSLLTDAGITFKEDDQRGYDHGVFVPLMIMYPKADIPILTISEPSSMSPQDTIKLGQALQPLRERNVFILGSGASFHNFGFEETEQSANQSKMWDRWLKHTVCDFAGQERNNRLTQWEAAPHARFAHPTEEHLAPLFAVAGAAGEDDAKCIKSDPVRVYSAEESQFVFGLPSEE